MSGAKTDARQAAAGAAPDLLNELLGIADDSPVGALRARRADIADYIQASYNALLEAEDAGGVSHAERSLIALRVAYLDESEPLVAHYRKLLTHDQVAPEVIEAAQKPALDTPLSPRQLALLAHVDRLTDTPDLATPEHLADLKRQGLTDSDIVTISQLIAFVSFQVRTLVGLQLLAEGM